ncbi:hypothetical protein NDU88_004077 [Pleurodeles waltl]|uniref:Uncharacterized protein n=1 Tax=Pleurodeles waltl TaxID=8319 RepID=A0AAV7PIQ6_PLEWA|nr:hypothetical protein NDU88_004077 [Pleurodeles waltl]
MPAASLTMTDSSRLRGLRQGACKTQGRAARRSGMSFHSAVVPVQRRARPAYAPLSAGTPRRRNAMGAQEESKRAALKTAVSGFNERLVVTPVSRQAPSSPVL